MAQMTKWERVRATLRGEPVDRPAWSLWRHFYEREMTVEGLAEAMVAWARRYEFDLLKVNPRAHYHVEDWGVRYEYSGQPHERPRRVAGPIRSPRDWERLRPLPPDRGVLGEHLRALDLIRRELGDEVPFVQTIFTPLAVAGYLADSNEQLLRDLREHPVSVKAALEVITETFADYARACLDHGASGIFLATTQWASYRTLTDEEYQTFGRPYDLRVLAACHGAPLNVLHVCGEENMLQRLVDYPVAALNWAATLPSNSSLATVQSWTTKAVIGGLSNEALTAHGPQAVLAQARAAAGATHGRRWFLGPNCSIPTTTPPENLAALHAALPTLLERVP